MSPRPRPRFVLGITGGIASGKTSVLQRLARSGIPTISSDTLAHQALQRGHPVYRRVVHRFGSGILNRDKTINRSALGFTVFRDKTSRAWLEKQIHPYVIQKLKDFIRSHRGLIALDIPLLYEAGLENLVDKVLVVAASAPLQIQRLYKRNGLTRADALRRIRAQMPLSLKRRRADYVIMNSGTRQALSRKIARQLKQIRSLHREETA